MIASAPQTPSAPLAQLKRKLFKPTTGLTYGVTGAGKTAQLEYLARTIYQQLGLKTRLYLSDNGSDGPWSGAIEAGIVELIDLRVLPHPFLWALEASAGKIPVMGKVAADGALTGKWERTDNSQIGLFVYDSFTSICERMFADLSDKAAKGINIGGEGAMNFTDGGVNWGEKITIGSSNRAHYMVVQQRAHLMTDAFAQLAVREQALVWATASEERGEQDGSNKGAVIGPKLVGKAMTSELPRLFGMTVHQTLEPTSANNEPGHKMWLVTHPEKSAGNVMALANRRLPMLAPGHPMFKTLPAFLDPADIVKALQGTQDVIDQAQAELDALGKKVA